MKKKIDKLFEIITKRVDFVNLTIKVKFFKGFEIYNNNDRIAFLTFDAWHTIFLLNCLFSLCKIQYRKNLNYVL